MTAANLARVRRAFFNEFVVRIPRVRRPLKSAEERGILAGLPLRPEYPELTDGVLVAVTEMNQRRVRSRCALLTSSGGAEKR